MAYDLEPKLDREKLLDVVHYICDHCGPVTLGKVKLHKILYYTDMLHYMSTGLAVTGVSYQKQRFGPVARHLTWAVEKLSKQGKIQVKQHDYFGFQKSEFTALVEAKSNRLTTHEVQLLNDMIDFVCSKSAKEISEISHDAPWQAAQMGENIPYYTVYGMFPTQLTEKDIEKSTKEALRLRPQIEAASSDGKIY